jgi:GT2 family glycosyltransferase
MEILFSKTTVDRKPSLKIETRILLDNDKKYVFKRGVYSNDHILNIIKTSQELKKIYKDEVTLPREYNGGIIQEYVEGKNLISLIKEKGLNHVVDIYLDFINREENIVDFTSCDEFDNIFGHIDVDAKAFKVSNIDLTLSNLIYSDDKLKMIDLEWVFLFPIPIDYIKYRCYLDLINNGIELSEEEFIKLFHIELNLSILKELENNFVNYVHFDSYKKLLLKENDYIFADYPRLIDESNQNKVLNEEVNSQKETIQSLNDENNRNKNEIREKEEALNNANNEINRIKSSTSYRFFIPYFKVRDFLFPKGSKRRLFAKIIARGIRHPIWFIKHLTPKNIKKFNRTLKNEGTERAMEKVDNYRDKTTNNSYDTKLELFEMKPRKKYPKLALPKPSDNPLVSIIIPVYNQFSYTYGCLESIIKYTEGIDYEVIIGDDCSTDETAKIKDYVKNLKVAKNEVNTRFLLNCKNAAKIAKGKYLLFLNNDTNVQPNWLSSLLETMDTYPNAGMVGSKLVYPTGKLQEAGGILWKDGSAWNYGNQSDKEASEYNYRKCVDYISGAAIMLSKELWDEIGGFDERFCPAYCEDSDLAFEVRKHGYEVVYDPFSVVVHYEGVSNGTDVKQGVKKYQVDNANKLYEKWKDELATHYPNGENVFTARDRTYNKKTVLMIDHYVPQFDKDAGSRTVYAYLKAFVKLGYNVKFFGENFNRHEPYTSALQKLGIEVLYGPYYQRNYKEWLKINGKNIDIVFFNRPHITKEFIDDVIPLCPKAKFIYYGHDLHNVRIQREYELKGDKNLLKEAKQWKEIEYNIFKKVDLIYYPSIVEKEILDKDKAVKNKNVKVLQPYFFDEVKPFEYNFNERKDILFVGGFSHAPNLDGIMWFIDNAFNKILEKYPEIVLHIAGSYPPESLKAKENKNIVVEGFVSDEKLQSLYSSVRLVVVPLRYGAGIKGKVIEAMSKGTPVITTSCGAEGINSDALCIDEDMLKVIDLYEDEEKLKEYSKKEIEFINKEYTEKVAIEKFDSDLNELLSK